MINNTLRINSNKEAERIVNFTKKTLNEAHFNKVIVGVSGGVDSATVFFICVKALGKENVISVLMPCGELDKEGNKHGEMIVKHLRIPEENIVRVDIGGIVDNLQFTIYNFSRRLRDPAEVGQSKSNFQKSNFQTKSLNVLEKVRVGNVMARVRMIILFDLAKKYKALVCGTENKTEYLLGYYTRFGDEASDFEPIRHLYKTQVYQIAKYLGVPREIIEKAPTAGLWGKQTDEMELGFTYEQADEVLIQVFDNNNDWDKIKDQRSKIKDQRQRAKILEQIEKIKKRVEGNWFKKKTPILINNY